MRNLSCLPFLPLLTLVAACTVVPPQGGNNVGDRSNGGDQGEELLTGAMTVSTDGKFALMQRNQTSVILDVEARAARELPTQVDRFLFAKGTGHGIAILPNRDGIVAYDLHTSAELWRTMPALTSTTGPTLAKLSDDNTRLVIGDVDRVMVLDATNGNVLGTVAIGSLPTELTFLPNGTHALVAGTTSWTSHKPTTTIVDLDLTALTSTRTDAANCSAPLAVLPGATRALMSPTFCEEGRSDQPQTWTNPDPVSIIDLGADGPHYLKNLPGFGPVALTHDGSRAIAYLDMQRIDESMFADKTQIPAKTGPRYHIMTINPQTLAFDLSAVGNVLPRFALSKDESALLVDATVQQFRGEVDVKATLDTTGKVTASVNVFGTNDSLFGLFNLTTKTYAPITGATASLDRFVQMGDGKRVFTLKTTADGLGGDLYRIDLDSKSSTPLNKSLRDIGLLADGATMLLRMRLPAVSITASGTTSWYRKETYCFSTDGINCVWSVDFQDSAAFQSGPQCTSYHDC